MGTRNLTVVFAGGTHRVAQYGQWDGYPSGVGSTVLDFCRENLSTSEGRERFRKQLDLASWIDADTIPALYAALGIDVVSKEWISMDEAGKFAAAHPQLDRDMGGQVLDFVNDATEPFKLKSSLSFANDSLFCEWAYVVDLDANTLEVFKGFQSAPHNKGRFATEEYREEGVAGNYWPVALVATYSLDALPTDEAFVEALDALDDEDVAAPAEVLS